MSNTTTLRNKCEPLNAVPADLPIPKGINYAATQGRNGSEPWMVKCCAPNPVSLVDGCYVWCELPKTQITTLKDGKKNTDFLNCIRVNGRGNDERSPVIYELNAPSGGERTARVTTKALGVWMIGMAGVVMRVFLGGSGKAAGRREPPFRSPAWLPGRGRSRGGAGIGVRVGFGFDTTTLGMKGDGTAEILHQMTYISLSQTSRDCWYSELLEGKLCCGRLLRFLRSPDALLWYLHPCFKSIELARRG